MKHDKEDQLVRKFGSCGTDKGQFKHPYGVAFDANNYLYVTDYGSHRVQKFESSDKFVIQWRYILMDLVMANSIFHLALYTCSS